MQTHTDTKRALFCFSQEAIARQIQQYDTLPWYRLIRKQAALLVVILLCAKIILHWGNCMPLCLGTLFDVVLYGVLAWGIARGSRFAMGGYLFLWTFDIFTTPLVRHFDINLLSALCVFGVWYFFALWPYRAFLVEQERESLRDLHPQAQDMRFFQNTLLLGILLLWGGVSLLTFHGHDHMRSIQYLYIAYVALAGIGYVLFFRKIIARYFIAVLGILILWGLVAPVALDVCSVRTHIYLLQKAPWLFPTRQQSKPFDFLHRDSFEVSP